MGLSTVWKLYQNTMNRQDTLELYDDQLYVLLGAVLVATSMTLVLSYFIACAGGLALQMRAGVENNPFYCTYFGSTVYMTNCTRCYEEAKPKSPCCPLWNSNAQSRKVAPVPREVEFVSAAPSTELIVCVLKQHFSGCTSKRLSLILRRTSRLQLLPLFPKKMRNVVEAVLERRNGNYLMSWRKNRN